uniref:Uncharacterized protein n=1 Tax=Aegilops tauschii subsp. strangulata TaxID=200361 RepID=A0A453LVA8_AEGTS
GQEGDILAWKGRENDGGSGRSNITSTHLHDKQENDQSHQRVPVLEPIIIPDCQDSEYAQSGFWWTFNNTSSMSSTSTSGSPIERVDYEVDCLHYEILWEDLVIGEQVGQGSYSPFAITPSIWTCTQPHILLA